MAGGVRGFDPDRLRAAQSRAGLSARQLARELGVTPGGVFSWRTGRARPFPGHLKKLADRLGCSTRFLAPLPPRPRLRDYRERAGLTQPEMAERLGGPTAAVVLVEGGSSWPDDPAWWAEAYGISVRTFTRAWRHAAEP